MIPPNRLVISEITGGQQTYEKPFFVNNDTFPILQNALCWRKSVIKKPGSQLLGQLNRLIGMTSTSPFTATISPTPMQHGTSQFSIGSVFLTDADTTSADSSTLISSAAGYSGTLNRTTGALSITIPAIASTPVYYYPGLPVLGIEQFESDASPNTQIDFPTNVFLDQTYSYQFNGTLFYDVSFYKETGVPVYWTGTNYNQFFSSNYYRALFVTNNNPGMQFKSLTNTLSGMKSILQTGATTVTVGLTNHGLANGDYVFINEVTGTIATGTGANANQNINVQSGVVTVIDANSFTLTVAGANFQSSTVGTGGIAQYLTRLVSGNGDGIRWYDGDPTTSSNDLGWVNFAPPLDNLNSSMTTYLVGARMIIPFGNRLLAIGTFEANSASVATPTYYGNRIRYCEVSSTPFYAEPVPGLTQGAGAFTGFDPLAWASNIQGYGGFVDLDTTQRIISAAITQGSMVLGLEREQRRMSLTGIETDPFTFFVTNPEYGTAGTHAIIPMDQGIVTVGEYGFMTSSSYSAKRFDEKIIEQIFEVNQSNNGYERICGGRDFVNEVLYFTYYSSTANASNIFPDTTVVYNYREGSFATWYESFTTYGLYKNSTTQSWQTYLIPWETWNEQWQNLGSDRYSEPIVCAGTPQGFVMLKWSEQSFNQASIFIQNIAINADGQTYTITSPNHNLSSGMYLGFWNGPASTSDALPTFTGQVQSVISINQFIASFPYIISPGTIIPGVWQISILDQIDIYTKQFQFAWSNAQKTRIGSQKYFLDTTTLGEFTVNIYGSQAPVSLNNPTNPVTTSLISSNIVRTRPDDSMGINGNQSSQTQIWHRLSTSCIGDTIQLEYTMSNTQMLNLEIAVAPWVLYSTILDLYPSRTLA